MGIILDLFASTGPTACNKNMICKKTFVPNMHKINMERYGKSSFQSKLQELLVRLAWEYAVRVQIKTIDFIGVAFFICRTYSIDFIYGFHEKYEPLRYYCWIVLISKDISDCSE